MKLTYSIKTVLRPDKKKADDTIPVHYSVRVGPTATRIPTGKSILMKDWNKSDNCPKKVTKQGQLLSAYLGKKMSDWNHFMLTEESLGKSITLIKAMDFFRENSRTTLYSFWLEQLELWQNSKGENTLKSYRSTLRMLQSFNGKLNFGDLSYDVIQKFDLYMTKEKGNSVGGKFPKHKNLKSIINQAIMKGYMNQNPYRFFKIKASVGKRAFLSIDEMKHLMNLEIPEKDLMLQKTRDLFVFASLTGLRYSDVMNLKFCNLKTDPESITVEMTKTKKQVMVPLVTPAKAIIEKYNKLTIRTPMTKVFPYVDNQVLNRRLKDLMILSGIKKSLTFHVSRHTFASCHVQLGTNLIHLKDLMGHSKITETQLYAKSLTSDLFGTMHKMQSVYDLNHAV